MPCVTLFLSEIVFLVYVGLPQKKMHFKYGICEVVNLLFVTYRLQSYKVESVIKVRFVSLK